MLQQSSAAAAAAATLTEQTLQEFSSLPSLNVRIKSVNLAAAAGLLADGASWTPAALALGGNGVKRAVAAYLEEGASNFSNFCCLGAFVGQQLVGALVAAVSEDGEPPTLPPFAPDAPLPLRLLHASVPVRCADAAAAARLLAVSAKEETVGKTDDNRRTLHLLAAATAAAHLGRGICKLLVKCAVDKLAREQLQCAYVRCDTPSRFFARACEAGGLTLLSQFPWQEPLAGFIAPYPHHFIRLLLAHVGSR